MSATVSWPDEVPMLGADNMCVGPARMGECGCLLTHRNDSFFHEVDDGWGTDLEIKTRDALIDAHRQLKTGVPEKWVRLGGDAEFITNHKVRCSRAKLARVWNRAMAILGYVVNNPECTRSGKLKPV